MDKKCCALLICLNLVWCSRNVILNDDFSIENATVPYYSAYWDEQYSYGGNDQDLKAKIICSSSLNRDPTFRGCKCQGDKPINACVPINESSGRFAWFKGPGTQTISQQLSQKVSIRESSAEVMFRIIINSTGQDDSKLEVWLGPLYVAKFTSSDFGNYSSWTWYRRAYHLQRPLGKISLLFDHYADVNQHVTQYVIEKVEINVG